MDALTFLDTARPQLNFPLIIVAGKERFLRRLVLDRLRARLLPGEEADLAYSPMDGETATWAAVRDELDLLPFGGGRRLVVVRSADGFVTRCRDKLEHYWEHPSSQGRLIVEVETWKSNTRLAKLVPSAATLSCEPPAANKLASWLTRWARQRHKRVLEPAAAQLLVSAVEPDLGVLDQELTKLTVCVSGQDPITTAAVDRYVANSRHQTAWGILDAVAAGQPGQAIQLLRRLLDQGDEPIMLFGALRWTLQPLAKLHRLCQTGGSLADGLGRVGLPPFKRVQVERLLRRLGPRAEQLFDWLMETEVALKSSDQLSPGAALERLILRLG